MVEAAIALIAGRQHGYITRAQLLALGLGRHAIAHGVEIGRLIPVYAGVYARWGMSGGPRPRRRAEPQSEPSGHQAARALSCTIRRRPRRSRTTSWSSPCDTDCRSR
ncbi:MAG: type IV toxin-antitoxin system AbiEi family antitoxin domain-containing protein [Solirubrobacteraceae bacterium]